MTIHVHVAIMPGTLTVIFFFFLLQFLGVRELDDTVDDLDIYEKVVREMSDPNGEKRPSQEVVMTIAPTRVLVATETPYVRLKI